MRQWAHTLASIAVAAISLGDPMVRTVVSHNPAGAMVAMAGWAVLGHLLPTPVQALWDKLKK
jgi:cytochrome b